MKKILLILLLPSSALIVPSILSAQSFSQIEQYPSIKGTNVLLRCNSTRNYYVTSYLTTDQRSGFIIDGNSKKHFLTTQSPEPQPPMFGFDIPDSGYVVNDMYFVGNVCWFCGKRWYWNGDYLLDANGNGYKDIKYCGYIGKFDLDDAMNGGGQYQIMILPNTRNITRVVVHGNNLTAFGPASVLKGNYYRVLPCVIELHYNTFTGTYSYKYEYTPWDEEELLDLVNANGKIVVLSRNTNPAHFMYYRFCFGLRYGTPGNFINTGNIVYNCNTDDIVDGNLTKFIGTEKLKLCTTNIGNGVAVSYVIQNDSTSSWKGRVISFQVPTQTSSTVSVSYNTESGIFSEIKESMFNHPLTTTTYMSLLLKDSNNNPVIFEPLFTINSYSAPVLSMSEPLIESVQPYQNTSNGFDLAIAGHYVNNANKLSSMTAYEIHDHLNSWYTHNCFSIQDKNGYSSSHPSTTYFTNDHALVAGRSGICSFRPVSYQTTSVTPIIKCTDGTNY